MTKPIKLSVHASQRLADRGATEEEVVVAIRELKWLPAQHNRLECEKTFEYDSLWQGQFYEHKTVRCVFVEEAACIIVITVYTYYF